MRTWIVMLLVACVVSLTACQPNQAPITKAAPPPPPPQNDALIARVAALETRLREVSIQASKANVGVLRLQSKYSSADFDLSDSTFQRIDSGVATFAVSVQDVSQFGDGVKLKLDLGNLTAASIVGVTLHVTYGPREPTDDTYNDWYGSLKTKDAEILGTLVPGSWNPTTVVLPGIEPKKFGYVSISIDTKTIALRKR